MHGLITELTLAMLEGPFEEPLWSSFLDKLRSATGADVAALLLQSPRVPAEEGIFILAGSSQIETARATFTDYGYPDTPIRRTWVTEGEPYTFADLQAHDAYRFPEFFERMTGEFSVADSREIRVQESSGIEAWLALVKHGSTFEREAGALLKEIAPVFRGVLRSYVAKEQEAFAGEMAIEAVRRLQFGWIALDAMGAIVSADYFGEQVLTGSDVVQRDAKSMLRLSEKDSQREFENALKKFREEPDMRPKALHLRSDPWLDMLLVPAKHTVLAAGGTTRLIAYVHGDNWSSLDRQTQLADLFALTASEAKLALALCRGRSIAEAAAEIGITEQSARTYSKSIFAKTGARGQPDLVRIIMGSIIAMAPEL